VTERVAIASLGAVGRVIARQVSEKLPEYRLSAVTARRLDRARDFVRSHGLAADVVGLERISENADIVIECAPAQVYREIAEPVIESGKTLITLSVGALLDHWDLVDVARATGGRILVPSGAILALDAVQGVSEGVVHSVRMVTRKPLAGLRGAPFLERQGIDLDHVTEPTLLFEGTAREAVSGFPANLNVSVALSLAGVGPDKTFIEVWADPTVEHNTHRIQVDSDSAKLDFTIQNIPSENPATGRLTPLSVVALLRKLASPLQIGT